MQKVSLPLLRRMLSYDPATGILRWLIAPARRVKVGDEAGHLDVSGYRRVKFSGLRLPAHRVAWALFYGTWPRLPIDHANGISHDNRIANLRLAPPGKNRANSVTKSKHGTKGLDRRRSGRWRVRIWRDGANRPVGLFDTKEEAMAAFAAAHRARHGEFSFTAGHR